MALEKIAGRPLWQKVAAVAVAALFSEDLAAIAAGILASEGVMTFGWALFAATLGTYLGDFPLYLMGRIGGIALLRRRPFRWFINEKQIFQAEDLFRDHGAKLIFTSRLLPGSRLPVYAAAGLLNYSAWKFTVAMLLAGGLSSLVLVWGSMRLGEVVFDWFEVYEDYFVPVTVAVVIVVWIIVKALEILATRRSRLVFLSRFRKRFGWSRRPTVRD